MRSRSIIVVLVALLAASATYTIKQELKPQPDISTEYHRLREKQCEYQFNITDDGYEIFQHGRPVGIVPIHDSNLTYMDSLLISDNE